MVYKILRVEERGRGAREGGGREFPPCPEPVGAARQGRLDRTGVKKILTSPRRVGASPSADNAKFQSRLPASISKLSVDGGECLVYEQSRAVERADNKGP